MSNEITPADRASDQESRNEKLLLRIVVLSSALAFGGAAASAQALRYEASGFSFHISLGTWVAFALGFGFTLLFWRLAAGTRSMLWKAAVLLVVLGLGLFFYPIRFVSGRALPEVAVGMVAAVFALSVLGCLVWQVKRFLDSDAKGKE